MDDPSRRRALATGGSAALAVLAGCVDFAPWTTGSGASGSGNGTSEPSPAGGTSPDGPTPTPDSSEAETHVAGVHFKTTDSDATYRVFVAVSAPEGSGVGGTWWQIERLSGERIARRTFAQPKSGRFKTEKTVDFGGASTVVVRGHGRRAEYGGRAMIADLESGRIAIERQGPEKRSFEGYRFDG